MVGVDDEDVQKHEPQNRGIAETKLRRSRRNCPVCLMPLNKNAARTKRKRACDVCGANPQPGKLCNRCASEDIWESRLGAACQSCGLHGKKHEVIASA
jgi:hypothetical protein